LSRWKKTSGATKKLVPERKIQMAVLNFIAVGLFVIGMVQLLSVDVKKAKAFSADEKRRLRMILVFFILSLIVLLVSQLATPHK
jgi:hypothetical protein